MILTGRPQNRSFQVYVVVEETIYSGEALTDAAIDALGSTALTERLHTPVAAEIVNQRVMVPKSFFDAERKALEEGYNASEKFKRKYSISAPVGPRDPVIAAITEAGRRLRESLSTATLADTLSLQLEAAREHQPELYRSVTNGAMHVPVLSDDVK